MNIKDSSQGVPETDFKHGRRDQYPVDTITIHVEEGTEEATDSWFHSTKSHVTAHYGNDVEGNIEQWVDEDDTAYANGRVDHPTAQVVLDREPSNPNDWTISIEHEGDGKHPLTDEQKSATVELIKDICNRRQIPIDRQHIIGHHEIYSLKTCPGAIDVDELVELANA